MSASRQCAWRLEVLGFFRAEVRVRHDWTGSKAMLITAEGASEMTLHCEVPCQQEVVFLP